MSTVTDSISLNILKDEFFNRMKDKAHNTLNEYRRSIGRLYEFMEEEGLKSIHDLTRKDIRSFQEYLYKKLYNSSVTIHYHLKTLSRFCNFLIIFGLLNKNPFKEVAVISKPATAEKAKRYYSHEETLRRYTNYLKKKYCYRIYKQYFYSLKSFITFLETKSIKSVCSVTPEFVLEYAGYLWSYRNYYGRAYSIKTIIGKLGDLKKFYRFFHGEGLISHDPTKKLNISKFIRELLPDTRPKFVVVEKDETQFDKLFLEYKNYLKTKGYAIDTIKGYKKDLYIFFDWLDRRLIKRIEDITKPLLLDYYKELHSYKGIKQKGWSSSSRYSHLIAIRKFFQFLFRYDYINSDPTATIEMPKKEKGLPMSCIFDTEARKILNAVDLSKESLSLRDKAILELLYSSAIRSKELCYLNIDDIDFENNYIRIRHAKGGKSFERVVPFGKLAHKALKDYLTTLRPQLATNGTKILFLSYRGNRLYNNTVCKIVKTYVLKAGIKNRITTHSWRVGCATELLRDGVDIRYVQEQLGHRCLESTKLYARLIPKDLKKMHSRHHPREKYYRLSMLRQR